MSPFLPVEGGEEKQVSTGVLLSSWRHKRQPSFLRVHRKGQLSMAAQRQGTCDCPSSATRHRKQRVNVWQTWLVLPHRPSSPCVLKVRNPWAVAALRQAACLHQKACCLSRINPSTQHPRAEQEQITRRKACLERGSNGSGRWQSATPLLPSKEFVNLPAWLLRSPPSVALGEHGLPGNYPAFLASCVWSQCASREVVLGIPYRYFPGLTHVSDLFISTQPVCQ